MKRYKALAFDVAGTVFDWKGAVKNALQLVTAERGVAIDGERFATAWIHHLLLAHMEARSVSLPHMSVEALLPIALARVSNQFPGLELDDAATHRLLQSWHEMPVMDNFPPALARMKEKYTVMAFTVMDFSIVTDCSKKGGISWDGVISCEFLNHYKTEPAAYLEACGLMGLRPDAVCMVSAQPSDLMAARSVGMGTACVIPELIEPYVPGISLDIEPNAEDYDVYANGFDELADMLCIDLQEAVSVA